MDQGKDSCDAHFTGSTILYFRAIHGHSGETPVDPSLLDNVLIQEDFFNFIYHIGSCFNMHAIMVSGLIAGGRIYGQDRQSVFFTPVDPMDKDWVDQEEERDLSQARDASSKHVWKVAQDVMN